MFRSALVFFLLLTVSLVSASEWVVSIDSGEVRGFWSEDHNVWSFRGIPYARPPLGELRFKSPLPPNPWTGVLNATNSNILCTQQQNSTTIGTEDCLILNVFVPPGNPDRNLPVLFFMHGGSFSMGNGNNYNPFWTTRHDIILITFNYRLGPLGFLCLGTEKIPGNAGLKDALAALRWTKRNIAKFGGDPNSVTIYGESAGGIQVEALVLSKPVKEEDLFQKAIVESGSTLNLLGSNYNRLAAAKIIAHNLGFLYLDDLDALADFLVDTPAEDLKFDSTPLGVILRPCIERDIAGVESVATELFRKTIADGDYIKVPILYAYAELDGTHHSTDFYNRIEELENNFENFLPNHTRYPTLESKLNIAKELKEAYFGNEPISNESLRNFIEYRTDEFFVAGMVLASIEHVRNSIPLYLMEFSYQSGFGGRPIFPEVVGAMHADIVAHVMDFGNYVNETLANDQIVRDRMTELFTNFVKFGNPTPSSSSLNIQWPLFTEEQQHYLNVGQDLTIRQFPSKGRIEIWDRLYKDFYYTPPMFEN